MSKVKRGGIFVDPASFEPSSEIHHIKVGEPHPYLTPRVVDESQIISVVNRSLTVDIWYEPPLDREINCLGDLCVGAGLFLHDEGLVPIFIFQSDQPRSQCIFMAPLDADQEAVDRYIASDDADLAVLTLMETQTGIVRVIRFVKFPPDFAGLLKAALSHLSPHPRRISAATWKSISSMPFDDLWNHKNTKRWIWNSRPEVFQEG